MASQNGSAQDGSGPAAVQQPPPAPAAARRAAAGLRAAGRPPRCVGCQVCGASLEGAKSRFYKRYHICYFHMAAAAVEVAGEPQRFCQQCGRFHPLDSFDGEMRSCRRQLARHAERRRAARAAAAAARSASAATSSPSNSQARCSGLEPPLPPPAWAAPASPLPTESVAAAVTAPPPQPSADAAAVDQAQAGACDPPQPQALPQVQASGSDSGSSSLGCPSAAQRSSPSPGLHALLAAAEEEEAAEQQAAVERQAAPKRRLAQPAEHEHEAKRPLKRQASAGPPEDWFAPPLPAAWAAPSKPATPTPDAAAMSCLSQQASLPEMMLPPLAPLTLAPLALPPLAVPPPALPPQVAAAVASLGASLQLLHQLPMQAGLAGLPAPAGWLEAYVAGLAGMAAERIMVELLSAIHP